MLPISSGRCTLKSISSRSERSRTTKLNSDTCWQRRLDNNQIRTFKSLTLKELAQKVTVKQLLTEKSSSMVQFVEKSSKTYEAVKIMSNLNIGAVIVKDDASKQPLGVFSERDYLGKLVLMGRSSKDTPISQVMTSNVICVEPHFSLDECSSMMINKQIRHLPVTVDIGDSIDQDSRIVGMISASDVLKELNDVAPDSADYDTMAGTVGEALSTFRRANKNCSVSIHDTVYKALEVMKQFNAGGVLVHDGRNALVGTFTERDYVQRIILKNRSSKTTPLGDVVNTERVTVTEGTLVKNVLPLAVRHRVIPVVSPAKLEPVGLLAAIDVLEFFHSLK